MSTAWPSWRSSSTSQFRKKLEELCHNPDFEGRKATKPGSLLLPHLTALPGSEDIGEAPPPVHCGGTGYTALLAWLQLRHSTASALLPIYAREVSGFNQRKLPSRTIAIAVDISRAFDKVFHRLLIELIHRSRLRHNLVRSFVGCGIPVRQEGLVPPSAAPLAFLPGAGGEVPQESVISLILFNNFVLDCPIPDLDMTSYADDFTANQLCSSLVKWADGKQLAIAPQKSRVTLLTSTSTSPDSTLWYKSVTRWPRWTEPLKSWVSRWTPNSPSAVTPAIVSRGY